MTRKQSLKETKIKIKHATSGEEVKKAMLNHFEKHSLNDRTSKKELVEMFRSELNLL